MLDTDETVRVVAGDGHRNRRTAPIVRAGPSRLLGWHDDCVDRARRRLVAPLPRIAFRPHS
ncbi:MAG: hypothetical protein ABSC95_03990 [Acetobacteraceae bacterium]